MMKQAPSLQRAWPWIAAFGLLLALAACRPAAPTAAPTLPAPSATFSPSPSPLPTLTPSPAGRGTYAPPPQRVSTGTGSILGWSRMVGTL